MVAPAGEAAEGDTRAREELVCFEHGGGVRWRYQVKRQLSFGGRVFDGPWYVSDMLTVRPPGVRGTDVWLAVNHEASWPSFVVKLGAAGRETRILVHSGAIYRLSTLRRRDRSTILAGGVNEEYTAAALAAVDATSDDEVVSPQTQGAQQSCDGCPPRAAPHFFVFPPSEVSRHSSGPYNFVLQISAAGPRAQIVTAEAALSSRAWVFLNGSATVFYDMSSELRVDDYSMGDGYWSLHRQLEASAHLKHPIRECPEFVGPKRIRVWTAGAGWVDLDVPAARGASWAGESSVRARP